MITYNDLYEALRKERYSEQLQPLPKKFIQEVSEYIKEKKEIADKKEDIFSEAVVKAKKQLENAVSLFRELFLRRKKKILNLVFIATETGISKRDFENMMDFEKEMFESIIKSVEFSDKKMSDMIDGKAKDSPTSNKMVVFLEDVEEFLGMDGNMLGPFEKGEVANLQEGICNILVKSGKAKIIEE